MVAMPEGGLDAQEAKKLQGRVAKLETLVKELQAGRREDEKKLMDLEVQHLLSLALLFCARRFPLCFGSEAAHVGAIRP